MQYAIAVTRLPVLLCGPDEHPFAAAAAAHRPVGMPCGVAEQGEDQDQPDKQREHREDEEAEDSKVA